MNTPERRVETFIQTDATFTQTLQYLGTDEYREHLLKKNLPPDDLEKTLSLVSSPEAMERRSLELLEASLDELDNFYGQEGNIIIPFSGGRDSSSIAALTLGLFSGERANERRIHLVTVLNGFSTQIEAPRRQALRIAEHMGRTVNSTFDPDIGHLYIDISTFNGDFIMQTAEKDREDLGYPSFCSACKIGMEDTLVRLARYLGATHIALGYNEYQGRQQWPEQSPVQIEQMQHYFKEKYPESHVGSPFYRVFESPVDPVLVLGRLGFPLEIHKDEMKCKAAGTNPRDIDTDRLKRFVESKLGELPGKQGNMTMSSRVVQPEQDYGDTVLSFKGDSSFMENTY
ncbi:MAG: hypothetical protein ACOX6V_02960 [Patescibacteria group bacterium]